MSAVAPVTVTAIAVADLLAGDERMPVYVHVIDHPGGRVLVDTGMTEAARARARPGQGLARPRAGAMAALRLVTAPEVSRPS